MPVSYTHLDVYKRQVISGVFKPSAGSVMVRGTIAPLIELGAGFDFDLTARENIFLNGTVLGMTPKYIREKFDEIVEFSELRDFLDIQMCIRDRSFATPSAG